MKFGVREICDVVLKAKNNQWVGNKYFYKNEPVIYFDTLKTSSMEGAATTVYAQGGRGNSRLVAWEGERTVTFTMEDALISPEGFMILSGAGLVQGTEGTTIKVHTTEQTNAFDATNKKIYVKYKPYYNAEEQYIYIMPLDSHGEVHTEPYLVKGAPTKVTSTTEVTFADGSTKNVKGMYELELKDTDDLDGKFKFVGTKVVLVDYYREETTSAYQIDITPDQFGGFYYLEASTLFRTQEGQDMPAEFVIPKCKIQSNFTFTMASSGDPSTFTFTIDAFPDYTRFDGTKKVFAAIQIISDALDNNEAERGHTRHNANDINKEHEPERPEIGREAVAAIGNITITNGFTIEENDDRGITDITVTKTNEATADYPTITFTTSKGNITKEESGVGGATVGVTDSASAPDIQEVVIYGVKDGNYTEIAKYHIKWDHNGTI